MTPVELDRLRILALALAIALQLADRRVEAAKWRAVAERWNALLQDAMPVFGGAS